MRRGSKSVQNAYINSSNNKLTEVKVEKWNPLKSFRFIVVVVVVIPFEKVKYKIQRLQFLGSIGLN